MRTTVAVTVRFFAAARAAAGVECDTIAVDRGTTVGALVRHLADRGPELAGVLARCSFLCDGVAVRDLSTEIYRDQTVDVLPPFAGG